MENKLPRLTYKQQKFILRYIQNGDIASEAYRYAYDCLNMSVDSINVEASRMLKNPKITLWIEHYQGNIQNHIEEEIIYDVDDAFKEFDEIQQKCMLSPKTYHIAMKAVENKSRIKGLLKDKVEVSGGATVQMGSVEINGIPLELKIGDSPDDNGSEKTNSSM